MDFRAATEQLKELGVSHEAQAEAAGIPYQRFKQYRMKPGLTATGMRGGGRNPPSDEWRPALAALAQERARALLEFAGKVRGE